MSEEFKKSLDTSIAEADAGRVHRVSSLEELMQLAESASKN